MIDPITLSALTAALDTASLRQVVGAANISQANSPAYQARTVAFESLLPAMTHGRFNKPVQVSAKVMAADLQAQPFGNGGVALDREMASLSRNAMHYQALIKALNGQFALMDTAATDGKR